MKFCPTISPISRPCSSNLSIAQTSALVNVEEAQNLIAWFGVCALHGSLVLRERLPYDDMTFFVSTDMRIQVSRLKSRD